MSSIGPQFADLAQNTHLQGFTAVSCAIEIFGIDISAAITAVYIAQEIFSHFHAAKFFVQLHNEYKPIADKHLRAQKIA